MQLRKVMPVCAFIVMISLSALAQPAVTGPSVINYPDAPFTADVSGTRVANDTMTLALDVKSDNAVPRPVVRFRVFAADGSCKGERTFRRSIELTQGEADTWTFTLSGVKESDLVVVVPDERRSAVDDFMARPGVREIIATLFKNRAMPTDNWQCRSECLNFSQDCFSYCGNLTPMHGYCTSCSAPDFECGDELICECIPNGGSCTL